MTTLLSFIILLGIIVFIHELGHFTAAKLTGMRVEIFSLGFGRALLKKKWGETEYRIAWIPLGGYVKISGMMDESSMGGEELKGESFEFESKNFFQKSFVILAGVIMNFILAVAIYSFITYVNGIPEVQSTEIKGFSENSPAEKAGFMPGDVINGVDGEYVEDWTGLTRVIHSRPDDELLITVTRADSILTLPVRTMSVRTLVDGEIKEIGLIGIFSETVIKNAGTRHIGNRRFQDIMVLGKNRMAFDQNARLRRGFFQRPRRSDHDRADVRRKRAGGNMGISGFYSLHQR